MISYDLTKLQEQLSTTTPLLMKTRPMAEFIGVKPEQMTDWLIEGFFIEPLHCKSINSRLRLWFVPMVIDRLANWGDDAAHQRAIDWWLNQLPSNKTVSGNSSAKASKSTGRGAA